MYHKTIVLICVAFISLTAMAAPAWAIKPRPPLQLSLHQTDLSGGETQVTMVATANVDVSRVSLSLELTPGLSLTRGEEGWEGSMRKGETQQVEWIIQSPDKAPRNVNGKAVIELNAGEKFVEKVTLTLNETKGDTPPRTPSVKRKEGGETILEFKGK